jgi:ABC-2 type transport system permease protein
MAYKQMPPTFEIALFFNPERRSEVNIVPGLTAVILTMTMVMFTSISLVREWELGNMELLITTPILPLELMIGKLIPYIFAGLIQVGIVLGLGGLIFSIPFQGDLISLGVITLSFIAASLTLGLLISTVARTQLQAMQMTFFILIPSILLSGFMFPFEAMPRLAQHIAELLPATHFIRLIRGVVLRGASSSDLTFDIAWLLAFTAIMLTIASLRFKKRLD